MAELQEQYSNQGAANTSTTSTQLMNERSGKLLRTQLIIVNTSNVAVVTLVKGPVAAVQKAGIVLQPNGTYAEATDGGYTCWQGPIQVISDVAGTVGYVESFIIR